MRCGTDILRVERIEKAIAKKSFYNKVYTKNEQQYIESFIGKDVVTKKELFPYGIATGLFCAKEAISKAFGTGLMTMIGFCDIEIVHDKLGAPHVNLSAKAKNLLKNDEKEVSVSIAHDGEYATAICVIL